MEDNMHDVVKLLLARMESHPEEFVGDLVAEDSREERWWQVLREVREYGTDEEEKALKDAMRKIKLDAAHHAMMDELCNGDERRRREQEEIEYERQLLAKHALNMAQQMTQQEAYGHLKQQTHQQQRVPSRHPKSSDMDKNGIMSALRGIWK